MSTSTHLRIVQETFPGALLIKPVDAGKLLNQSRQSSYNQIHEKRFPVPLVVDHLGRKMVRVCDLAQYLDDLTVIKPVAQPPKPPKGRPKKSEQLEAQRRAISIQALRAEGRV
ncbi:MAG: hypothetical protein PHE17_20840 [Thiothrix sp.]|uniref:hypothetical protein n=1 Tax=Thiothrix sp. TaxID=1032 RepID=UPI00262BF72F|nr:hypothetical protein [Thiothrix sp.]MDD5395478.1 hypothetical protein [Thiothrix sp.]